MKSTLIKQMEQELGIKKIQGKKLKAYGFYTLIGFYTRLKRGEDIK